MSPLSSSMQNLAAASPTAITGSPLRRIPPALSDLPSRPVVPRATKSGSKIAMATLNKVDEKVVQAKQSQSGGEGAQDASLAGKKGEDSAMTGASGVARLIAEANRRAQAVGRDAASNSRPSTSPVKTKDEPAPREDPSLTRSMPTLPARTDEASQEPAKSSSDISTTSLQPSQALRPPPRRNSGAQAPPRKGSLNAAMRSAPSAVQHVPSDRSRSASVASNDSSKLRRLPPRLSDHATMPGVAGKQEDAVDSPVETIPAGLGAPSLEAKKIKPAVPPKPRNL